ncbi:cysteine desulfurase [Patescibacteria group bacterium]|nr:cysteine desulfurase [Patescibacteria group bacterium]MBU4458335.1 cysteine desulfurase [Patescibacteria group bacterium]MCG2695910.1 cysteine desulfurase [Candidatus Portnoybacteria bacterium]
MSKSRIYFDYAATTSLDAGVLKKMMPYLTDKYGNPSSIHKFGQEGGSAIDEARKKVAKFLNCKPLEIVFTGSASESDNLAIRGLIKALKRKKQAGERIHIIISKIEHKAVLETCRDLEKEGIRITYLPVGPDGLINLDDLRAEITPETDLVSIMYANNEVGSVQPIKKIGKIIGETNKNEEHPTYFHVDAVQAANWLDCRVDDLKVDLLTLSAHKIYGPKGVGILYIKEGTPIASLITGGSHEWKLRAGTENVAGIVGMGEAIAKIRNTKAEIRKMEILRNKLVDGVLENVQGSKVNGSKRPEERLPNIVNFSFLGVEGESLVIALDQEGIAVSTGSACTSTTLLPSHVLIAMGLPELDAHSSLRVSMGKYTTIKEIDYFIKILPKVVEKLRKISGR